MPSNDEESQFPDEIRTAFDNYPQPRTSPNFDARFWSNLEARRGRYRGFGGFLRRLVEVEIEGVAVWRLALSTLSGGASCALFFALAIGFSGSEAAPLTSEPRSPLPETPRMALGLRGFYAREWEEFGFAPPLQPAAPSKQKLQKGGEISCAGSETRWV